MKKTFIIAIVALFSVNTSVAQKNEKPVLQYSKIVHKSANEMWDVVRKLDKIDKYSSAIARVVWSGNKYEGGTRVCYTPDGQGYFKEKIINFDESTKSFTYSLLEGAPVKGMVNTMQVADLGNGKSVVVWWTNYDEFLENPQMTQEQFHQFMLTSLDEMVTNMSAE